MMSYTMCGVTVLLTFSSLILHAHNTADTAISQTIGHWKSYQRISSNKANLTHTVQQNAVLQLPF